MTSSYLFLNGLRVHYLHWNLEEAGRPVVLLHDLDSNARVWELVAPSLAGNGLVPLAPDLRGHGLTDKPGGDFANGADFAIQSFARDLAAFIEASNLEKPLLAGHGSGALLALEYASRLTVGPHAPSGIVLIDGGIVPLNEAPPGWSPLSWGQFRDQMSLPHPEGTPLVGFLELLQSGWLGWIPSEQAIPLILASYEVSEDEMILPRLPYGQHLAILQAMGELEPLERYPRLHCPVLLLPARPPDPLSSEQVEALALTERGIAQTEKLARQVQVQWMPGSAHDLPLQRPAEVADRIVAFAASLLGR